MWRRAATIAAGFAFLLALFPVPALSDHAGSYDTVLEPGFAATPYAHGAVGATSLAFGPEGNLYVATVSGTVYRFRDVGGVAAGPPESFISGLEFPLGLAWGPDGALYVSSVDGDNDRGERDWGMVSRVAVDSSGQAAPPEKLLVDLPQGHSQTNGLAFGPDGLLYVANGSSTDDGVTGGPPDIWPLSGSVVRFDPEDATDGPLSALAYRGSGVEDEDPVDVVATGLRNNYDVAFSGEDLYMTTNGPETTDPYADDLLFRVEEAPGASLASGTAPDFGFPGCLYSHDELGWPVAHVSPHPELPDELKTCDGVAPPLASYGLHPSANGLAVAPDGFGPHGGHVFAAEWGSFSGVRGHKIVRVGIAPDGSVVRTPEGGPDMADFMLAPAPIDLVFRDGAMHVADFGSGVILRVVPVPTP